MKAEDAAKDSVFDSLGGKPEYWTEEKFNEFWNNGIPKWSELRTFAPKEKFSLAEELKQVAAAMSCDITGGEVVETDDGTYRTVNGITYRWHYGTGTWVKEGYAPTEKEADDARKRALPAGYASVFNTEKTMAKDMFDWKFQPVPGHESHLWQQIQSISFGGNSYESITLPEGAIATTNFVSNAQPKNCLKNEQIIRIHHTTDHAEFTLSEMPDVSFGDCVYWNGKFMGVLTKIRSNTPRGGAVSYTLFVQTCGTVTTTGNTSGGSVSVNSCYPIRHVTADGFELNIWPGTEVSHAGKIYSCGWDYAVTVKDCLPEKPKCAHDWRPSAKGKKWCATCGAYEDPKPPDFPAPEPTPPMPEERYD